MKKEFAIIIATALLIGFTGANAEDLQEKTVTGLDEINGEYEALSTALTRLPGFNARIKPIGCKIDANWQANQYLQACNHPEGEGRQVSFIKFKLPEDRETLLSKKMMDALAYLARNAAMRQANKDQMLKGSFKKVKVKDDHLYEQYLISPNYIGLRLTWDEPAEGYLVVESNSKHSALAGLVLATPFATWEPSFGFGNMRKNVSSDLVDALYGDDPVGVSDPETGKLDHLVYSHICELSLLIGYGNGKGLMQRLVLDIKNSDEYTVLMTNALPSAIPFYEKVMRMQSIPVHRYKVQGFPETRRIRISKQPYYHYLYAGESLMEEERAHMYATPIDQIDMNIFMSSGRNKRKYCDMEKIELNPFGATKRVFSKQD